MRFRASLISLALILCLASASEAAAPKEGAKCTKLNQVSKYKNYKFTCIKKSGKLVWGKGVPIKSPLPTQSPTPSPSASPSSSASPTQSATPIPTPTPSISPAPSPSPSPTPTPSPTPSPTYDEETFKFDDICQTDPFIPAKWSGMEQRINPLKIECSWPYRIVKKVMPTTAPKSAVVENYQGIGECKILNNQNMLNVVLWPSKHVDFWNRYERHPSLNSVVQLIPIFAKDAPDNGKDPGVDYAPYTDFLKEWIEHASDGAGRLTVRSPNRYIEFPDKLADYLLTHTRSQTVADNFRLAIEKWVVPKIDLSGANLGIIVLPPGSPTYLSEQVGLNQIQTSNGFVKLMIVPPFTLTSPIASGSNFIHPAWWLHELHHVTSGLDDNDHETDSGLHWWGLMSYGANEMLGWQKWLMGLWGDNRVSCVDPNKGGTYWIAPNTYQSDKKKLIVLRSSANKVVVIESMRAGGLNYKMPTWMEGALVYSFDSTITGSHKLPIVLKPSQRTLQSPTLKGLNRKFINSDAALKEGESTIFEGFKISVIESGDFGDVIKIERVIS